MRVLSRLRSVYQVKSQKSFGSWCWESARRLVSHASPSDFTQGSPTERHGRPGLSVGLHAGNYGAGRRGLHAAAAVLRELSPSRVFVADT